MFIVRKRKAIKGAENVFFCPLFMDNKAFLDKALGKSDKKSVTATFFLEKMKKICRRLKKIEKNLDNILAKCYNMLYCR